MIDAIVGVRTDNIQWYHNGRWAPMPHRHFFGNNLREHFKKQKRHMPVEQRKVWSEYYRTAMIRSEVVHINNLIFKLKEVS